MEVSPQMIDGVDEKKGKWTRRGGCCRLEAPTDRPVPACLKRVSNDPRKAESSNVEVLERDNAEMSVHVVEVSEVLGELGQSAQAEKYHEPYLKRSLYWLGDNLKSHQASNPKVSINT